MIRRVSGIAKNIPAKKPVNPNNSPPDTPRIISKIVATTSSIMPIYNSRVKMSIVII